ncbi:MAG: O-antigen ligase family protein [Endomicrobiales bacterium]
MATIVNAVNQKIISFTEKIILVGIPVLYFLISIAFYLRTYDSAQIKITLIQIGGTVLLAAWLVKLLEENAWPFLKENIVIVCALLAFLLSGIVSYLHSPLPLASAQELARRIFYIGIALIVIKEFNSEDKLKRLFNWLIAAAFVATLYGIIQYLDYHFFPPPPESGLDPFIWRGAFSNRIFSTFGNPNFFGDFLVVMSPITLALFMRTRKVHLLFLWVMIAFCVIFTRSKGAWLGFGAGLVIFVFLWVGFFLHTRKVNLRRILFGMMIGTVALVSVGIYHNLKGRPDSGSFRIFTWVSTWEMINTHPWLGTGIGTFYVTYPAWRRPQIFLIEGRHNTETDHPEDEYLEVWYDEGLVGFGIFLWLLSMFLLLGFRNLREFSGQNAGRNKGDIRAYYQLGLLTALSAQLVHNLVCVSLRFVSSGIFLWLLIGLVGALSIHHPLPAKSNETPKPSLLPKNIRRALQLGVVGVAAYFVSVFYGYFDADVNHNMAIFFSKQGQWDQALDRYNTVVKENPAFIMAHYFMGNVYNDRWRPGDMEKAIEKYKDVWKLAPNYVQSHHQAGLIFLKAGEDAKRLAEEARRRGDAAAAKKFDVQKTEHWNKALSEFEHYRRIDPIFPLNYYRIAWVQLQMGHPDKAEETYRAHLDFMEKLKQPPYNTYVEDWPVRRKDEYAETCVNLGNLRFSMNDLKKAEDYYQQALQWNPHWVNALKNLAMLYGHQGRNADAAAQWQKLKAIVPQDPDVQRVFQARPAAQ